jgi:hypothetical protein
VRTLNAWDWVREFCKLWFPVFWILMALRSPHGWYLKGEEGRDGLQLHLTVSDVEPKFSESLPAHTCSSKAYIDGSSYSNNLKNGYLIFSYQN